MYVRPKKHLGQHFLKDETIAQQIAAIPSYDDDTLYIEIGPGTGVLTKFILAHKPTHFCAIELDQESVVYLHQFYPELQVIEGDFLRLNIYQLLEEKKCTKLYIIGNFPYNISSQILVKAFEMRDVVVGLTGMFQKEVCDRIKSPHGNKQYGILSVYLQSVFDVYEHFVVPPNVFNPPPKVFSSVLTVIKNNEKTLRCPEDAFKKVIRTTFNQRRKMLRNTLKPFIQTEEQLIQLKPFLEKRPEQLSPEEFQQLVEILQSSSFVG